jgi:hypothetical protein
VRLDLDEPRTLGELVGVTFALFGRHLAVFLSLTLLVVTPILLIVDGVWGGYLAEGGDADPPTSSVLVSALVSAIAIPPLITSLLVTAVQAIARGEEPTVGATLRAAGPRVLPAFAAVTLFALGVAVGLIAFIVPGVWLSVRWYFCAQAVVVEGLGPVAALRRSAEIVATRWWRTFGVLMAFVLVLIVLSGVGTGIAARLEDGALYMTAYILIQAVVLSLSAIYATLLFFDTRARAARAVGSAA